MSSRHDQYVARAPLFDRLVDLDPLSSREVRPFRSLTYDQLLGSIRQEIERLLNTRCMLNLDEILVRDLTVIDYGSSDLSWISPLSNLGESPLSDALSRLIQTFEPRLRHVTVLVESFDTNTRMLYITINGHLHTEHLSEPVSFPVTLHATNRQPESHGI